MDPEELTQRALVDTMEERRNWDPGRCSLDQHLAGCINSYISHYFESREARVQVPPQSIATASSGDCVIFSPLWAQDC